MKGLAIDCRPVVILLAMTLGVSAGEKAKSKAEYYDLGGFHYEVTTDSKAAQLWFDRGLAMCYGFNHEEGVRCFEKAIVADPGMAMGYWGIAYALGPNINRMEIEPAQIAKAEFALQLAKLHAESCTELERELITALSKRYATPVPHDRDPLNRAYADALREIHAEHQDDPLVVTVFAESLMNLQPWKHWSPEGKPGPHTFEIVAALEAGLKRWPEYPSLCHLYIHAMEASPTPEKALPAADQLRNAMPGQGHLVHMPSHIDIWVGHYDDAIEANRKAIAADVEFLQREGPFNFYSLYRIHNYHFLVYGAMFDGQSHLALKTAKELSKQVPEDMVRAQTDFLDAFMPTDLHVMVRFGRWEDILKRSKPADYLPVSRSVWHYARALAFAATNRIAEAEAEQELFKEAKDSVPETSFLFQNASLNILGVAEEMIAGEISYRKGDLEQAFEHLREAVRRDDALNYDEPWGWMQPARHALGALLLEQNQLTEAAAVYRKDLKRHPNNPWALRGLADCLTKLGKEEAAAKLRERFKLASRRSDVDIDRSCYCKLSND